MIVLMFFTEEARGQDRSSMPPSAAAAHAAVTGGSALLEMLHKSGQMGSNCKAVVGAAQVIICKENRFRV